MKINICASEDPQNSKTWSRTPLNIITALKNLDSFGSSFASTPNNIAFKILLKFLRIMYNTKGGEERIKFIRYMNGERVIKKTSKSKSPHTLHMGTFALPFKKLPTNQFHYLFIDATWKIWSSNSTGNNYSRRIKSEMEKLEKEAYQQVKHIFSISDFVKKDLIDHYKVDESKITVVGTGTGIIKPFFGRKDYSNGKILFAAKGRFADKGGDLVIDAFKIAIKTNPSLHLSIVGQNEYTGKISHPNISTYGFIPIEELQDLFNSHSVFLMPAFNEPWGLVYIEAMLCKMPIIGLKRNSFPELSGFGKFGVGLNTPDAELLAETILILTSNTNLMEEMGKEAQKHCMKEFTWDRTVNKILDHIN